MRISLKGTNLELVDSIRVYVEKKIINTVERLLARPPEAVSLDIEVGKTTKHHKSGKVFRAEVNLSMGKKLLRAESLGENLHEAIDLLEEEIEREIKKFKGKRRALALKGARKLKGR